MDNHTNERRSPPVRRALGRGARALRAGARGATALALSLGVAACAMFVKSPAVTIADVRVASVGVTGATAQVALEVSNPNRFDLTALAVNYRLSFEDGGGESGWWLLAEGESEERRVIRGRDTTRFTVSVPFRYADLGRALGNLMSEGELRYRMEGDVKFDAPVRDVRVGFDRRGSFAP